MNIEITQIIYQQFSFYLILINVKCDHSQLSIIIVKGSSTPKQF